MIPRDLTKTFSIYIIRALTGHEIIKRFIDISGISDTKLYASS